MNKLLVPTASRLELPMASRSSNEFGNQRQALYDRFEAERKAEAALAESSPLVQWARHSMKTTSAASLTGLRATG